MKILICTSFSVLCPSAARNRLNRMRKALAPHGIEMILVGAGDTQEETWSLIDTPVGPCITFNPNRVSIRRHCRAMTIGAQAARFYQDCLQDIILETKCDGVIAYTTQAQLACSILNTCRQADVFVVADVVEYHQLGLHYLLNGMNWQQFAFSRWYLPQMDGVIGISKGWCEWASKQNIPNVWIPSFAEDHGIVRTEIVSRKQPFILTFIGHWVPRELPKVILRAIRICLDQGFDVRMNVLGNVGSTYRERSAVRMLEKDELLKKHVQFLGFVSDEERDSILAESDGFIILRHDNRETDRLFPTRLPEYMLTGNPVILTKTKGFGGYFEHRKDVWFVSPENNPEEIANALIHLVRNPKERMVIGKRGRNKALSDFSLEILGVNLAKFLYEINETKINKN